MDVPHGGSSGFELKQSARARRRRPRDPKPSETERFVTIKGTMAVSKELLDILVCPLCKAPVHLVHYESGLKCEQCKRVYPIRDDIPVMLIDEAEIEK